MIEPVGAGAAERLAAIHARAFDKPWGADELRQLFANPAVFALASPEEGFVMAWSAAGDAELITVAVVPEARRRGLGGELVSAAAVAAAARGAASLHLEVAENNVGARALYAKLGFEQVGRRAGYYTADAGALDAVVMRLTLQPADE